VKLNKYLVCETDQLRIYLTYSINKTDFGMRKLKLQVQMSIDGFIAGPNGEMDWMVWDWDDALKTYVDELTKSMDCIFLGRKLAEGFIPYWKSVADDPNNEIQDSGKVFTNTPRVVFSKTITESPWENATIANGGLVEEITSFKQQPGKDIIAYGGANFVSNLIKENLIDELHLFVNPTAIGKGMPIFADVAAVQNYRLGHARSFDCGIVVMKYSSVSS